jgi:hypothetical protein
LGTVRSAGLNAAAGRHSAGTELTARGENLTELDARGLDPAGRRRCMEETEVGGGARPCIASGGLLRRGVLADGTGWVFASAAEGRGPIRWSDGGGWFGLGGRERSVYIELGGRGEQGEGEREEVGDWESGRRGERRIDRERGGRRGVVVVVACLVGERGMAGLNGPRVQGGARPRGNESRRAHVVRCGGRQGTR